MLFAIAIVAISRSNTQFTSLGRLNSVNNLVQKHLCIVMQAIQQAFYSNGYQEVVVLEAFQERLNII